MGDSGEEMENTEVTEVTVGITDISEGLPSPSADDSAFTNDSVSVSSGQISTSAVTEHVFAATPTGIFTANGLPVQVQDDTPLKSRIIAVVQQSDAAAALVDGLKTPATPCTPSSPSGEKRHYTWDDTVHLDVLPVRCRNTGAELFKSKLGSGGRGKCVRYNEQWYTPSEFESLCGRGNSKDWKRSIRFGGRTLQCLIEEGIIQPHAASCTCASCCDDEGVVRTGMAQQLLRTLFIILSKSGPVRLFVPYKRRKRDERESMPSTPTLCSFKKKMPKLRDVAALTEDGRSMSLESQNGLGMGDSALTLASMTPTLAPMTPNLTPLTPLPPMTPSTPKAPDLEMQQWWHLEEMASQLIQQAQTLKQMIDQAKHQSQSSKEAALTQAKIQYETEKKQLLADSRMEAQLQLSRALMEAKAEKDNAVAQALAQAQAEKIDAVAEAKSSQLIKACANCGREATSECTGCHRVSYCSGFCQRKDWTSHQHSCGHNQGLPQGIQSMTDPEHDA
ncbi:deformed epidermal autoregulatory factor 1 homolog isoform X2 [Strongylocentrotus purpuratus]|uniref:Deformed epidermal autoregulatory factor 1 homolog n=1 Tax=Strongylocentrotus purpuratus TaxID=7668 RepID=A0A7M7T028_STRPU|nr:deformed epidermal autoregulatory factor 1 homolog isoform X2 [Strongylocentrotus purpuratus]